MNAAFDLTALFKNASLKNGPYVEAVRLLRNIEASRSKYTELKEAREQFEAGNVLGDRKLPKLESQQTAIIVEALFVHAIILYCRAVHSSSKSRRSIDIIGALNSSQRLMHKKVTSLRDQVLAHYGRGESQPAGPWVDDRVVLQLRNEDVFLSYPSMRAAHKAQVARELLELIDAGLQYLERYSFQKATELVNLLKPLLITPEFSKLLASVPFDETEFFGRKDTLGTDGRMFVEEGQKPNARSD